MTDDYAERAARVLAEARNHLDAQVRQDSETAILEIEEAIVISARRVRHRRAAVAGLASAALLGIAVMAISRWLAPVAVPVAVTPVVSRPVEQNLGVDSRAPRWPFVFDVGSTGRLQGNAGTYVAAANDALAAGDRIETDVLPLAVRSPDGTRLVLGPHSDLALERSDAVARFRIAKGTVNVKVSPLSMGERFLVETPDREIEVKGTHFDIGLGPRNGCSGRTVTRVAVEEGTVIVRSPDGAERIVRAGERWPIDCVGDRGEAGSARLTPNIARTVTPARSRVTRSSAPSSDRMPSSSTLAIENDMFSAAARAARAGDRSEALRLLERLIADYPASPLREGALVERAKLLSQTAEKGTKP